MAYTVKRMADLSGVSERTLRYYDSIDLLHPAYVGANGYRYYDDESALRLQQILFFRALGFTLDAIKEMLDDPGFDRLRALEMHRSELTQRAQQLNHLIHTIDQTIRHLKGEITMSSDELFEGFTPEKQAEYEQEARARWGDKTVEESNRRWNSFSKAEQEALGAQIEAIFRALRDVVDQGPASPAAQEQVAALHRYMQSFYPCPLENFRGLGQLYHEHPGFIATFERLHPALPEFLFQAITIFCDQSG